MKKTGGLNIVLVGIAFGIFALSILYMVRQFQWGEIIKTLRYADAFLLISGGIITTLCFWFFRTLRWLTLLGALGYRGLSFTSLYLVCASSLGLSIMTPFQSGELVKVELLSELCEVKRVDGYTSFALERFVDLSTVLLIAFLSIILLDFASVSWWTPLLLILVAVAVGSTLYFITIRYFGEYQIVQSIKSSLHQLTISPRVLMYTFLYSIISWAIVVIGWMIFIAAIDISISAVQGSLLTSGVTLINIVSFIPGAIGVSEVSASIMLEDFGVAEIQAQAGALLIRFYALYSILLALLSAMLLYSRGRSDESYN